MRFSDSPAWGLGLATVTADDQVLDTWFPAGWLGLGLGEGEARAGLVDASIPEEAALPGLRSVAVDVRIGTLADPPKDASDVYLLRLVLEPTEQLLGQR